MAAPADGGRNFVALLPGASTAAAAAALQPTPTQLQPGVQMLPPTHVQLQQHQQQMEQQQRAGVHVATAQLSLPFVPGLVPLGAGATFPGLAQLQTFGAAGQVQQHLAPLAYLAPPGAASTIDAVGGSSGAGEPVYVNPRQLAGILRRRKQREQAEAKRRLQPRKAVKKVRGSWHGRRNGGTEGQG